MSQLKSVLTENRVFPPSSAFVKQANIAGMDSYHALCREAEDDFIGFWRRLAQKHLLWHKPFTHVLDESHPPFYRWFDDGLLNASVNCLDKHMGSVVADKTAIIFEADDGEVTRITYRTLLTRVCQFANALKAQGISKRDRVIIYMPMSIEVIVAMQACTRIGAIHSVVFAGFSAQSLHTRIVDTQACLIITANHQIRGGKTLALKTVVDEALAMDACDSVNRVLVYQRTQADCPMQPGRDLTFVDALANQADVCEPEIVDAEHPLFILYTSGSTGKPKGVQHATAGYLLWAKLTMDWVFDLKPSDVFWCTADVGWITGHTYGAYGPLVAGATQILFEGIPTYPDASRFWQMIARHHCSIFYTAPTAIRTLIKAAETHPQTHPSQYDLSSLRIIGSVGEPINPEVWMWYYQQVGQARCPIVDTFWQTETGGQMLAPLPGATPLVPGSCTLPLPGIVAGIVDETGQDLPHGHSGKLVFKKPWPAMARTLWHEPERFKKAYFPEDLSGYYLAGDAAVCDKTHGYFRIMGRLDDVLNVSGHRLGSMEIESALVSMTDLVAEAAVVSRPDALTGEAICAFVVLKRAIPTGDEAQALAQQLRQGVAKAIGAIAKPADIRFGDNLPKTRSGKIMRRLLRAIAANEPLTQDISTLENPAILKSFSEQY